MQKKLYCFDFDGTLTTKDTMIELIRYTRGTRGLVLGLLANGWYLMLMKSHLYPNWRCKERIIDYFFGGMNYNVFNNVCNDFANSHIGLIRPEAIDEINRLMAQGGNVIIVSASGENWVAPMMEKAFCAMPTLTGTLLEVKEGKITGKIVGHNCYGEEKVNRIKAFMDANDIERKDCCLYAYGDSTGDKEMLEYADESFYKPFNNRKLHEMVRFAIVGIVATAIQYGCYLLLNRLIHSTAANTVAYIVSFVFNYVASTHYTFKVKSTTHRCVGFVFSHFVNYVMQTVVLAMMLWTGIPKDWAMVPVFVICVPINLILVRYFLKK